METTATCAIAEPVMCLEEDETVSISTSHFLGEDEAISISTTHF